MNFSYSSRAMLLAVGVCAALSAAQAAPDAHDFGIKIEKPPASKPKTDKPKTAAPKVTAPKATAPKPASVPQAVEVVSVEAARVPLLLRQMEAGQLTPEAAWKSGALTREGLLYLFERHLDVWKLTEANPHRELYLQLAGLLAPQMSEVAKPSRRVRLWLGEFYRAGQDERAGALLESVLGEFKAPGKGKDPIKEKDPVLFLATERLAWFYRDRSQHEQAAQTWLRLESLASDAHWKADGVMEAAREYVAIGQAKKAQELYADVEASDDGHMRGMAIYDQAAQLLSEQPAQARDLVLQKMPTLKKAADRVGPLWVLAQAQWNLEAWPQAEAALREMLQSCPADAGATPSLLVIKQAAQNRLHTVQERKTKPFVLPLQKLLSHRDAEGTYHATLYVHSFLPQPVEVKFADAGVRLNALTQLRQHRTESGVLVTVYDLSYSTSHSDEVSKASLGVKNNSAVTQEIELRQAE